MVHDGRRPAGDTRREHDARHPSAGARRRRKGRRRDRPFLALVAVCLALVGLLVWTAARAAEDDEDPARSEGTVRVVVGGRTLLHEKAGPLARLPAARLRQRLARIPDGRLERRGRASIRYRTDRAALARVVRRTARGGGGTVPLPERAESAQLRLAVVKQVLRNNCETAALSMLLRARGRAVDQLRLQRQLPRSRPIDPEGAGPLPVWGDPREGFVGRPEGGGPAGGYGVYQPPILRLARRHEVALRRLAGTRRAVYGALLEGRPVMAWVGLSDGPIRTWRTRSGARITGNFGEHTVVLTGLRGDRVTVNDPLSGQRLIWTRSQFETLWERLGRRALAA